MLGGGILSDTGFYKMYIFLALSVHQSNRVRYEEKKSSPISS